MSEIRNGSNVLKIYADGAAKTRGTADGEEHARALAGGAFHALAAGNLNGEPRAICRIHAANPDSYTGNFLGCLFQHRLGGYRAGVKLSLAATASGAAAVCSFTDSPDGFDLVLTADAMGIAGNSLRATVYPDSSAAQGNVSLYFDDGVLDTGGVSRRHLLIVVGTSGGATNASAVVTAINDNGSPVKGILTASGASGSIGDGEGVSFRSFAGGVEEITYAWSGDDAGAVGTITIGYTDGVTTLASLQAWLDAAYVRNRDGAVQSGDPSLSKMIYLKKTGVYSSAGPLGTSDAVTLASFAYGAGYGLGYRCMAALTVGPAQTAPAAVRKLILSYTDPSNDNPFAHPADILIIGNMVVAEQDGPSGDDCWGALNNPPAVNALAGSAQAAAVYVGTDIAGALLNMRMLSPTAYSDQPTSQYGRGEIPFAGVDAAPVASPDDLWGSASVLAMVSVAPGETKEIVFDRPLLLGGTIVGGSPGDSLSVWSSQPGGQLRVAAEGYFMDRYTTEAAKTFARRLSATVED